MMGSLPDIGEEKEDTWAPDVLEDVGPGHIIDQTLGPRSSYEETGGEADDLRLNETKYGQENSRGETHCLSDNAGHDMFFTRDAHNPGQLRGPHYRKKLEMEKEP